MRIEVIGQRLLTGRVVIADSALVAICHLYMEMKKDVDYKITNGMSGAVPLSKIPRFHRFFEDVDNGLRLLDKLSASV